MPDKSPDRRTLRTKKLLRQALVELIEEKGLEKITVSDLTARAEINRGTFYLHYKDVTDLLERIQEEILAGLSSIADAIDIHALLRAADKGEGYSGIAAIFEFWSRHAEFGRVMFGPKGDPSFLLRMKIMMKTKLYDKLTELRSRAGEQPTPVPGDFLTAYMASANIGLVQHWFETGRQQSPAEAARFLTYLIHRGPLVSSGIRPT